MFFLKGIDKYLNFLLYLSLITPVAVKHQKVTHKIYGGHVTSIGKYPSIVGIFEKKVQVCGGTIISKTAVITAAHCWDIDPPEMTVDSYQVRAGSSYRSFGGTFYNISRIVIHRGWNNTTTAYDYALVRIKKSFVLSESVAIVPLVTVDPPVGAMVTAVGWGATNTSDYSDELNEVEIIMVSRAECKQQLSDYFISDSMICAGYPKGGKDTCTGDSGGPLYYHNKLAGVTSWGAECGVTTPGVYSSIAYVIKWIEDFK